MSNRITNIAGYQFTVIDDPNAVFHGLHSICSSIHVKGNIFISPEGINLGLAGTPSDMDYFLQALDHCYGFNALRMNTTYSDFIPFKRLLIKIRNELVPTRPLPEAHPGAIADKPVLKGVDPDGHKAPYIGAEQLKRWLDQGEDITLLDMRNTFEVDLGSFENAVHFNIRNFRDIIQLEEKFKKIPKNKPLVTFCTGGIRCEKGATIMMQNGFEQVFQLEGGILGYIEKYKGSHWRGECFVFDDRVCLNTDLQPSDTRICRHCQIVISDAENEYCEDCAYLA